MDRTVDFKYIYIFVKKYWLVLSATIVLSTILSLAFTQYFVKPIYEVSTDVLVVKDKDEIAQTTAQSTQQFISTYSVITKSTKVIGQVKEELNLKEPIASIKNRIKIENQDNSQIITIKVKDATPQKAEKIATEIVIVLQEEIKNIMNEKNITVLSPANAADSLIPINISKKVSMLVGFAIGTVIGVVLSILMSVSNTAIKSHKDIAKLTDIPVIGTIQKEM